MITNQVKQPGFTTKRNVLNYLSLTFSISWSCWIIVAIITHFTSIELFSPIALPIYSIGAVAPMISALIMKKKTSSKEEFQSFRKNIFNLKKPILSYVIVFGLAWGFCSIPVLLGGGEKNAPVYVALQQLPLMIFFGGGLEEVGWRGYLQPMLQRKFSSFVTTIMISVIWLFWHLPLWFVKGSGQDTSNMIDFAVMLFSFAFLLTFLWNKYKSIALCIILHASFNSFTDVYSSSGNLYISILILFICFIIYWVSEQFSPREITGI